MTKKITTLLMFLVILSCLLLASCGNAQDARGTAAASTEAAVQTVTGTGKLTWHGSEQFVVVADVTVRDGVIERVTLRDSSAVSTDAFDGWNDGRDAYLQQYIGLTADQILALQISGPENASDHHDGGSIRGDVDAITGATASSTVVAMAVQDAVSKLG